MPRKRRSKLNDEEAPKEEAAPQTEEGAAIAACYHN